MAEAMKTGATNNIWMRIALDKDKGECVLKFSTNIARLTLNSENKYAGMVAPKTFPSHMDFRLSGVQSKVSMIFSRFSRRKTNEENE